MKTDEEADLKLNSPPDIPALVFPQYENLVNAFSRTLRISKRTQQNRSEQQKLAVKNIKAFQFSISSTKWIGIMGISRPS